MLMAADSELSSSSLSHSLIPNSIETLDESSSSQIASIDALSSPNRIGGLSDTTLMADSGISSLSSAIPNSIETLDDSSSSLIAKINTEAVQSLAISSPNRDSDSIEATDGSSSSSSSFNSLLVHSPSGLEEGECNDTQFKPESQILPLNQYGNSSQAPDEINDSFWDLDSSYPPVNRRHKRWLRRSPYFPPSYYDDSDDDCIMQCRYPFLKRFQEPLKIIEEPITGVGAGLWNLGNTCFINSVLQCFTHTVPLIQSLRSYKVRSPCNCENDFCVIRTLIEHMEAAHNPLRFSIRPILFLDNLNYFSPYFQRFHQEDAHEFLQAFLDKLEKCCIDRRSNRDGDNCDISFSSSSSPDVNIVDHVFTGRLVSELRCCTCNSVSETFESSLALSLGIEDVDTLSSALDSFTCVEKIEEQLTCDKCEEKVSKEKRLLLDKLPLVVTFHFKRFKNNGIYTEKIFKHVKIPLEIDLNPYMQKTQENETKYNLYAFVEHLGFSLTYGHYSSYVRSAPGIWHKFDDSQVIKIDEDCVLTQNPYILFYAREGTQWFSTVYQELNQPLPSPKSVLDSNNNGGGGGECLSEISYENNNKPNGDMVMKAEEEEECSGEDQVWDHDFRNRDSSPKSQGTLETLKNREKEEACIVDSKETDDSCLAATGETFCTKLEDLETVKNGEEEEACKTLSDIVDLKETGFVHCGGGRELDQGIVALETGSPSKKLKTEYRPVY